MGLMDNMLDAAKKGIESSREKSLKQAQCQKDRSLNLTISFGNKELGIDANSILRQKTDGTSYFNFNDAVTYRIIGYEWKGPVYENVMTTSTRGSENSTTVKKGKSGKMATGALVGTLLFPGVGTVVGAAIGAGGKGKSNTSGSHEATTNQVNKRVEKDSTAILRFLRLDNDSIYSVTITCNSSIDAQINCFHIDKPETASSMSKGATDVLKGIKALKELLDMGAITQEEFELKKKQMLGV